MQPLLPGHCPQLQFQGYLNHSFYHSGHLFSPEVLNENCLFRSVKGRARGSTGESQQFPKGQVATWETFVAVTTRDKYKDSCVEAMVAAQSHRA